MKILNLYLKNFSRVKSALGVDEVTIDFRNVEDLFIFLQGGNGCVDKDTEFFNGIEWKKISEWNNDKVLYYNSDGTVNYAIPEKHHVYEAEYLNHVTNKTGTLDMQISDEHRVVYMTHRGNLNIKEFKEFNINEKGISSGSIIPYFTNNMHEDINISDDFIRLKIAIFANGYFPNHVNKNNYCRIDLKKEDKKERLRYLFDKNNINYTENNTNPKDQDFRTFVFNADNQDKHFPKEWYNMSRRQLEIVFDEVFRWDGSHNRNVNRGFKYRTFSKDDADFIQFVAVSLGKRTSIKTDDRVGQRYGPNKQYARKKVYYEVKIHNNNQRIQLSSPYPYYVKSEKVKTLDGKKYSFTVPSGMYVARRNNQIFITGNSGKSTLLNQLHPWRDSYDGNSPLFYDEAIKEVTIDHENGEYLIKHLYGKVSKTFIYKNGELLNSNGHVREGEAIINDELGYTPEFLELSRISSSMSGFLDKKSTERKKFITSLMPSLDFYIKSYDNVRAKISDQNRKLRSTEAEVAKLAPYSEEDIVFHTEAIDRLRGIIQNISNEIAVLESKLKERQEKIDSLKHISETDLANQETLINSFSNDLVKFIEVYGKKSTSLAKEELASIKEDLIKTRAELDSLRTNIRNKKEESGQLENTIKEDENFLETLSSVNVDKIKEDIKRYEDVLKSINTENKYYQYLDKKEVTMTELINLENFIQYTVNTKYIVDNKFKELAEIGIINIQNNETRLKNDLVPIISEIKSLEKVIGEDSVRYRQFEDSKTGETKHCDNPNCPYEMEIKEYEKLAEVIADNRDKLKELEKTRDRLTDEISDISIVKSKAEEWLSFKKKYSNSTFEVFTKHYDFYESDDLVIDYRNFYNDINKAAEDAVLLSNTNRNLEDAKNKLKEAENSETLIERIKTKLTEQKTNQTNIQNSILENEVEENIKSKRAADLENTIKLYDSFIEAKENLQKALDEKTKMTEDRNAWLSTYSEIESIKKDLLGLRENKSTEENNLRTNDERLKVLERLKLNKEILENELEEIRVRLNTLTPISNALDPKKGIPVVFQRVYLKQTAFLANKLLKIAYGEKFEIDFELTDNDFFIRVTDNEGNVREDARLLSDGEKSVVGLSLSLALIEQTGSGTQPRPLYLDEADGVLDSHNRRSFINILESQLSLLGIDQCFIISHNDSFKDVEASVILLRDDDKDQDHIDKKNQFLENKKIILDYRTIE